MEKMVYSEDMVSDYPNSSSFFVAYQTLKDELSKMEAERDAMLLLLNELSEAEDQEELEEAMSRVREFAENREYLSDY